ncbi:MAG: hypothetical protein PHE61_03320 [Candidatus Omnitrophica bacterium]|nr:hypothetical protein [Candidatus Omnitrophota bacterium]
MSIINEALKKAGNVNKPEPPSLMPLEKVFEPFRGVTPEEKTIVPEDKIKVSPRPAVTKSPAVKKKANFGWLLPSVVLAGIVIVALLVFKYGSSIYIPLAGDSPKSNISLPSPAQPVSSESALQAKPETNLMSNLFNLKPEPKPAETLGNRQFLLTGISNSGGSRAAIINGEVVEESGSVDGARVISITDREVDLQTRDKTITLTLD